MRFLNPEHKTVEQNVEYEYLDIVDGETDIEKSPDGKYSSYVRCITLKENRYYIRFVHHEDDPISQFTISFGLTNTTTEPVTNAGLKVFGQLADEIFLMYEQILKEQHIKTLYIQAAPDGHTKDELARASQTIEENKEKLDGFSVSGPHAKMVFKDGFVIVSKRGLTSFLSSKKILVSPSLLADIKHVAHIDPTDFLPDILAHIKAPGFASDNLTKKQNQRLKLYQFYLHKRFPKFTFNSETVTSVDGKREIEFKKDKQGTPYLLVNTHN